MAVNPSQRIEAISALVRTATLPIAIEHGRQLSHLLSDITTELTAKNMIAEFINDAFRFFGHDEKTAAQQDMKKEIGRSIIAQFPFLNIEEIALAFQYGKAGKFGDAGKPFGKLSGANILSWLTLYLKSDEKTGYWERNNTAIQAPREPDDMLGALMAQGIRIGFRRDKLELTRPDGSSAPAQPAPGSAVWHRMQADRLEAQQKAKEREIQQRQALGQSVIAADELARQEREKFLAHAETHFYGVLSKAEIEITEAYQKRLLSVDEMAIYVALNQAWEQFIADYQQAQEDAIRELGESNAKK